MSRGAIIATPPARARDMSAERPPHRADTGERLHDVRLDRVEDPPDPMPDRKARIDAELGRVATRKARTEAELGRVAARKARVDAELGRVATRRELQPPDRTAGPDGPESPQQRTRDRDGSREDRDR